MSIASQLYQLQEVDTELESDEQAVTRITRQLADNTLVNDAQGKLDTARLHMAELSKQQRSLENDIADISSKLATIDKKLYGGKVGNPKELTDLNREAEGLKIQRSQLEEKELAIMEQAEAANKSVSSMTAELKKVQTEQQGQHKQLSSDLEKLKAAIIGVTDKRKTLAAAIDPQSLTIYQGVKKQRGTAVAKVAQGLCTGCRISLPVSEFQKAKSGALVRCGSCGRILFMS